MINLNYFIIFEYYKMSIEIVKIQDLPEDMKNNLKTLKNKITYLKKKILLTEAKLMKENKPKEYIERLISAYDKEMLAYKTKIDELKLKIELDRINSLN